MNTFQDSMLSAVFKIGLGGLSAVAFKSPFLPLPLLYCGGLNENVPLIYLNT